MMVNDGIIVYMTVPIIHEYCCIYCLQMPPQDENDERNEKNKRIEMSSFFALVAPRENKV